MRMAEKAQISSPFARPAQTHKFNLVDRLFLPVLVVVWATQTENAQDVANSGIPYAIRTAAALIFCIVFSIRAGLRISFGHIAIIFSLVAYFLLMNAFEMSFYAIMGAAFMACGLIVAKGIRQHTVDLLDWQLKSYLVFHLAGLLLAFAIFAVSRQFIDLHSYVFPYSASRAGEMWSFARLTGFQIEPGNYATYGYAFVMMRSSLRRRIFDTFNLVIVLSTLVTLSAWAVVGAAFFFAAAVVEFVGGRGRQTPALFRIVILCVAGLAIAFVLPLLTSSFAASDIGQYFDRRFSLAGDSGSSVYKFEAAEAWFAAFGSDMLLGHALPQRFCQNCVSPQDLGTLPNMMYYLGIVPTTLICLAIALGVLRSGSPALGILLIAFATSKLMFFDPVVWLAIGLMIGPPRHALKNLKPKKLRSSRGY